MADVETVVRGLDWQNWDEEQQPANVLKMTIVYRASMVMGYSDELILRNNGQENNSGMHQQNIKE
jgi:hypothetical protein